MKRVLCFVLCFVLVFSFVCPCLSVKADPITLDNIYVDMTNWRSSLAEFSANTSLPDSTTVISKYNGLDNVSKGFFAVQLFTIWKAACDRYGSKVTSKIKDFKAFTDNLVNAMAKTDSGGEALGVLDWLLNAAIYNSDAFKALNPDNLYPSSTDIVESIPSGTAIGIPHEVLDAVFNASKGINDNSGVSITGNPTILNTPSQPFGYVNNLFVDDSWNRYNIKSFNSNFNFSSFLNDVYTAFPSLSNYNAVYFDYKSNLIFSDLISFDQLSSFINSVLSDYISAGNLPNSGQIGYVPYGSGNFIIYGIPAFCSYNNNSSTRFDPVNTYIRFSYANNYRYRFNGQDYYYTGFLVDTPQNLYTSVSSSIVFNSLSYVFPNSAYSHSYENNFSSVKGYDNYSLSLSDYSTSSVPGQYISAGSHFFFYGFDCGSDTIYSYNDALNAICFKLPYYLDLDAFPSNYENNVAGNHFYTFKLLSSDDVILDYSSNLRYDSSTGIYDLKSLIDPLIDNFNNASVDLSQINDKLSDILNNYDQITVNPYTTPFVDDTNVYSQNMTQVFTDPITMPDLYDHEITTMPLSELSTSFDRITDDSVNNYLPLVPTFFLYTVLPVLSSIDLGWYWWCLVLIIIVAFVHFLGGK